MDRPTSVITFGVLNIIIGGMGICSNALFAFDVITGGASPAVNDQTADLIYTSIYFEGWAGLHGMLSAINSLVLFISGIGLLSMQDWGRKGSLIYAASSLVTGFFSVLILTGIMSSAAAEQAQATGAPSTAPPILMFAGMTGACCCLTKIYPFIILGVMLRPQFKAHFLSDEHFYPNPPSGGI